MNRLDSVIDLYEWLIGKWKNKSILSSLTWKVSDNERYKLMSLIKNVLFWWYSTIKYCLFSLYLAHLGGYSRHTLRIIQLYCIKLQMWPQLENKTTSNKSKSGANMNYWFPLLTHKAMEELNRAYINSYIQLSTPATWSRASCEPTDDVAASLPSPWEKRAGNSLPKASPFIPPCSQFN